MSRFKQINPTRSEEVAVRIIAEARVEAAQAETAGKRPSGNFWHGLDIRYRNRLMSEAGYGYNEAYHAMRGISWRRGG